MSHTQASLLLQQQQSSNSLQSWLMADGGSLVLTHHTTLRVFILWKLFFFLILWFQYKFQTWTNNKILSGSGSVFILNGIEVQRTRLYIESLFLPRFSCMLHAEVAAGQHSFNSTSMSVVCENICSRERSMRSKLPFSENTLNNFSYSVLYSAAYVAAPIPGNASLWQSFPSAQDRVRHLPSIRLVNIPEESWLTDLYNNVGSMYDRLEWMAQNSEIKIKPRYSIGDFCCIILLASRECEHTTSHHT